LEGTGVELIEFGLSGKRPWLSAAKKLTEIVKSKNPDVISSWLFDANISARLFKLSNGSDIPIVTCLQATDYDAKTIQAGNWSVFRVTVLKYIDWALMRATKPFFVACSNYVLESFVRNLGIPRQKTRVIYNSVDPTAFEVPDGAAVKLRVELGLEPEAFIFLNIGRLDPQKNQKRLIEAVAKMSANDSEVALVILGAGILQSELRDHAKEYGITDQVRFAGVRNDIATFLEMADCFVLPSLFEGLPLALIEAMSKGVPCVSSDIEVVREVITDGESGILVDPYSVTEIADALALIKSRSDLQVSFREAGKRVVRESFEARPNSRLWEEFYSHIIEGKPQP